MTVRDAPTCYLAPTFTIRFLVAFLKQHKYICTCSYNCNHMNYMYKHIKAQAIVSSLSSQLLPLVMLCHGFVRLNLMGS